VNLELLRRLGPDGAVGCALEFGGPGLRPLSMDARFTLPNMAVELGADTGLVECDEVTAAWLSARRAPHRPLRAAPDASYARVERVDLSRLEPLVALPPDLTRVVPAAQAEGPIDRVFVGSCTNGRHEDILAFADALGGRRVAVETLVTPGSRAVFDAISRDGTLERLHAAGCVVLAPGCGACLGRHQGVLAAGERVLTTFNRNYPGRMGAVEAEIWLAGPHVAAATAVAGRVAAPALALPEVTA
jgi:homoaconitase/3-isopropylmalate dehydratase large subunit